MYSHSNSNDTFEGVDVPLDLQHKLNMAICGMESHNLPPAVHENSSDDNNNAYYKNTNTNINSIMDQNMNTKNTHESYPSLIPQSNFISDDIDISKIKSRDNQEGKSNQYLAKTRSSGQVSLLSTNSSTDSLNLLLDRQRISQLNHPMHQVLISHHGNDWKSKVKETNKISLTYDPVSKRKVLNTYEIIRELGQGQHGKVKLAKDVNTNEFVAIKIVNRHERNKFHRTFFKKIIENDKIKREIAIMKKLHHPHVVKLIEVLDDLKSRKIYLVLEYCSRGEVKWYDDSNCLKMDAKGPPILSFQRTREIIRGVVLGLEYLHYQGIIHRDIKPANLLISEDGTVKISDFDVSLASTNIMKHCSNNNSLDTQPTLPDNNNNSDIITTTSSVDELELAKTAGTPAFFAPEICLGEEVFTRYNVNRTELFNGSCISLMIDIWALGVTLYCLLFGKLPFVSNHELELFEKIVNDKVMYPSFNELSSNNISNVSCEQEYDSCIDLLDRLLEKNPAKRIPIADIKTHSFICWDFNHIPKYNPSEIKHILHDKKEFEQNHKKSCKPISITKRELKYAVSGIGKKIKDSFLNSKNYIKNNNNNNNIASVNEINSGKKFRKNNSELSLLLSEGSIMSDIGEHDILTTLTQQLSLESIQSSESEGFSKNDKQMPNRPILTKKNVCDNNNYMTSNDLYAEHSNGNDKLQNNTLLSNNNDNDSEIQEYNNVINLPINSSFASLDSFYIDNYALSKVGLQSPSLVNLDGSNPSSSYFNTRNPSFSSSNGFRSFLVSHNKLYGTNNNNNSGDVISNNSNNTSQTNFTKPTIRTPTPRLETKNGRRNVKNIKSRVATSKDKNRNKKNENKPNNNIIFSNSKDKDVVKCAITDDNTDNGNNVNNQSNGKNLPKDDMKQLNNNSHMINQYNPLIPPLRRIQRGNFIDALNGSDSDSHESGSFQSTCSSSSSSLSSSSYSSSSSSSFSSSSSSLSSNIYHPVEDINSIDSLPFEFAVDPERVGSVVSFDMSRFQGNGFTTNYQTSQDI